ncbi:DNA repair protein RadC [Chlamydia abortus]|jgi:DNA repair protein RadC|nr:DNA repair protein RadC [Chlamydia abortus]
MIPNNLFIVKNLLAATLREKPDSYVIESLFNRVTSLQELLELTEEELVEFDGIGPAKAKQIRSVFQLGKFLATSPSAERVTIRNPGDAYEVLKPLLLYQPNEKFVVAGLNTKHHVVFTEVVSSGTVNSCLVTPLLVFRPLLKRNCCSGLIAHSHPSGDPSPSPEDLEFTRNIVKAAEILKLDILDHIIVGNNCYYSMKEHGVF